MALEIKWSRYADRKFDKLIEDLTTEWGENVARSFVKKVYDFLSVAKDFPETGTLEHPAQNIRGFVLVRQITVFYKIKRSTIVILNFYDNRQLPKKKRYGRGTK